MKFIDLSQPIYHGSPNCPVHPAVRSDILRDHPADGWRVELLTLSNHTGSHVDAPLHKIAGGASLDDIPLERFAGSAYIVDLRGIGADTPISEAMLRKEFSKAEIGDHIILLATGWGEKRTHTNEWLYRSPHLSVDGAEFLVERKVRAVGIDHYSIGGMGAANPVVHHVLLSAGVWIVEELRFPEEAFAVPQPAKFLSLPVNLKGHTGAFCRPVLMLD